MSFIKSTLTTLPMFNVSHDIEEPIAIIPNEKRINIMQVALTEALLNVREVEIYASNKGNKLLLTTRDFTLASIIKHFGMRNYKPQMLKIYPNRIELTLTLFRRKQYIALYKVY